jgi:hypothetical protein
MGFLMVTLGLRRPNCSSLTGFIQRFSYFVFAKTDFAAIKAATSTRAYTYVSKRRFRSEWRVVLYKQCIELEQATVVKADIVKHIEQYKSKLLHGRNDVSY